jgi:hypothetical protein
VFVLLLLLLLKLLLKLLLLLLEVVVLIEPVVLEVQRGGVRLDRGGDTQHQSLFVLTQHHMIITTRASRHKQEVQAA